MSLTETLRALCVKHDFTTMVINVHRDRAVSCYAHWTGDCGMGMARTVELAIADCIKDAQTKRAVLAVIPALELGEAA